jgi:hypothetical protein
MKGGQSAGPLFVLVCIPHGLSLLGFGTMRQSSTVHPRQCACERQHYLAVSGNQPFEQVMAVAILNTELCSHLPSYVHVCTCIDHGHRLAISMPATTLFYSSMQHSTASILTCHFAKEFLSLRYDSLHLGPALAMASHHRSSFVADRCDH